MWANWSLLRPRSRLRRKKAYESDKIEIPFKVLAQQRKMMLFILFLCVSSIVNNCAQSLDQDPVLSVVFNPNGKAPVSWAPLSRSDASGKGMKFLRVWGKRIPPEFRYMVRARKFQYNFKLSSQGNYTIRLGLLEKNGKACAPNRRQSVFKVNEVESNTVDVAQQAGCGVPLYINLTFSVPTDGYVSLSFQKLPKNWSPTLSNFQIFKIFTISPVVQNNSSENGSATIYASPTPQTLPSPPQKSPSPRPSISPLSQMVCSSSMAFTPSPPLPLYYSHSPTSQCMLTDDKDGTSNENICGKPNILELDVGPSTFIAGSEVITNGDFSNIDFSAAEDIPHHVFAYARESSNFSVSFHVNPGLYTVTMAFLYPTEEECRPEKRVFHLEINGRLRLASYDIADSVGCGIIDVKTFINQPVDFLDPKPMVIKFTSIIGKSFVNYIHVSRSQKSCEVPNYIRSGMDHLAHSVPGTYPSDRRKTYTDHTRQGFVPVTLDGTASHTHFYDGQTAGKITSYIWTIANSGMVLSKNPVFVYKFPLGTTHLRLTVIDSVCSEDEADTYITVTDTLVDGAFCYFYEGLWSFSPLQNWSVSPSYASIVLAPIFDFQDVANLYDVFTAKCEFSLEIEKNAGFTKLNLVANGGDAHLYADGILQLASDKNSLTSKLFSSSETLAMELYFRRSANRTVPRVTILSNSSFDLNFRHEQADVQPVITSIDPSYGPLEGGIDISIVGYGLHAPLKVFFGEVPVIAFYDYSSSCARLTLPPSTVVSSVSVWVETTHGFKSNSLPFEYDDKCDSISFSEQPLTRMNGSGFSIPYATAVSLWQDGSLYIGTRKGVVHVLQFHLENLKVTSHCFSRPLSDTRYKTANGEISSRAILGIAFDPRDTYPRPYVTVSSLFWQRQGTISRDNPLAWSNGAIERMVPTSVDALLEDSCICLKHDATIVQNLPVSDGDHSVNELLFTQYGDILVGVGGNTNMGLPYFKLGGNWESPMSSAVLIARVSRPSFNGTVVYSTPDNLRTAVPLTDDVGIYATGVRNPFAMSMTRSGRIFGLDMGPNCGFGNSSTNCGEYVESEALLRSTRNPQPFPGLTRVGKSPRCTYSTQRNDKLLEISENAFYGHPNLQRAQWLNLSGECAWVDPISDVPTGHQSLLSPNYKSPVALIQSPATGIREYGGTEFCGRMRGRLIVSSLNGRRTWAAALYHNKKQKAEIRKIASTGGLRVEETIWGDLLFVPYQPNHPLFVLRPVVHRTTDFRIVNVLPFRHGKGGGSMLMIGGWGFKNGVEAYVGEQPCKILEVLSRKIACIVPSFRSGSLSKAVTVKLGDWVQSVKQAVLYMHV